MPETTKSITAKSITFPRDLFLDRRVGKYCFRRGAEQVLMAEAGKAISREELKVLFHPYVPVKLRGFEDMFDEEVLAFLNGSAGSPPAAAPPAAASAAPPRAPAPRPAAPLAAAGPVPGRIPEAAPRTDLPPPSNPPVKPAAPTPVKASVLTPQAVQPARPSSAPSTPTPPPAPAAPGSAEATPQKAAFPRPPETGGRSLGPFVPPPAAAPPAPRQQEPAGEEPPARKLAFAVREAPALIALSKGPAGAPPAVKEPPAPSPPPPAAKLANLREDLREKVFQRIATSEGEAALLAGQVDGEIRGLVSAICQEVTPRQILATPAAGTKAREQKTDTDFFMDHAMTSQAFGAQLSLADTDLFLVVKSAILQTLTEADRNHIQAIKQSLLQGKASPNFEKRLSQYYSEIVKYLKTNKVDPTITDLIYRSKYVYFDEVVDHLPPPSIALGVADAFVTLREAGKLTLEILGSLPGRLKKLLPHESGSALHSIETLLRDSCYNEFRKALDSTLSGGDHCDFFSLSPFLYGLMIFDVSGHEKEASELKDILVKAIAKLPDRTDPARTLSALNRFVTQFPFPEETFVSMVYGLVDLREGRFTFANAGHHPPYLIRSNSLNRLESAGGIALNMGDPEYRNGSVPLQPMDCLVLYTDGLTEAVSRKAPGGPKELFGHRRLETAIAEKSIGGLKAKRAVESILAAVADQGFQIEDDITIQVYRHV
jgi:stage II sporulation SpoE-like protein